MRCAIAIALALLLAELPPLQRTAAALVALARLTGQHALDPLAHFWLSPVVESEAMLALPDGRSLRARRYAPGPKRSLAGLEGARDPQRDPPGLRGASEERGSAQCSPGSRSRSACAPTARTGAVVLLHGVHPQGIDERHLVEFARTLAAAGLDVSTPELPELLRFRLDAASVAQIREAAAAHAQQTGVRAVGAIGISFAGGLALLAAAEQASDRPIGFVVSVGGHDDLLRLTRYYAGSPVRGPRGEPPDIAPHPYGARVMIREHLDRFFAPGDLPAAERALDLYLRDRGDLARQMLPRLSPAGREVLSVLLERRPSPALTQLIEQAADLARPQLMAASPTGKLATLRVPVLLIHGQADPIIPSLETRYLARELPPRWLRQTLITPLLRHTEFPEPPGLGETYELVRFMRAIFEAAGSCSN